MIRVSVMYPAGEGKKFFTDIPPQAQISEIIHS